jgi:membrane protein implicated in regulation of membrane protease activity
MRPWIAYTLLRVGLFAAFFAVLFVLGLQWWLAAVIAAALGLVWLAVEHRRVRRIADRWYSEHPEVRRQRPAS